MQDLNLANKAQTVHTGLEVCSAMAAGFESCKCQKQGCIEFLCSALHARTKPAGFESCRIHQVRLQAFKFGSAMPTGFRILWVKFPRIRRIEMVNPANYSF